MIRILYGRDNFQIREALTQIRDGLGEGLESNTSVLDGSKLTPQEVLLHASAVPFLASARLVIVEGLLAHLGEGQRGRGRKKAGADDALQPWRDLAARLADPEQVPPTTVVVFVDGELSKTNPALVMLSIVAEVSECLGLTKNELPPWIEARAARKGLRLAPRALGALAQLVGPDLWALDSELDKLAAYGAGGTVDVEQVQALVSAAQETKVWEMTDAVVAGDEARAVGSLRRLLDEGQPATMLAFMVARHYRQLVHVKDLRERRVRQDEVARVAGVPAFKLNTVTALANRYSWAQLAEAYGLLLEADLSVKRGLQDDESALQLVLHQLCALAPGRARAGYTRSAASRSG
ncbi:MAG: DNA polymerase III subunit delta [Dehalococcoidia bacterium]